MWGLAPWFMSGVGLGWYREKIKKDNANYYGPPKFGDYIDRPTWFNPISGTNADSYFIGGTILVLLFMVNKK